MKIKGFKFFLCVVILFQVSLGCKAMALELKSSSFSLNGPIPSEYSCDGQDSSPELSWEGAPDNTSTFALICDDPDAPMGTWVHWVIYNIPCELKGLPQGLPDTDNLRDGIIQGVNDFKKLGYGGPCPPPGKPHRYFFKLYALDSSLDIKGKVTKEALLSAMKGHVLAEAVLIGTYQRQKL